MAVRESLKDLQTRLADRLRLARSSGVSLAWLAVTAGGGNYLMPLRQSGEILPMVVLQAVPRTQAWFVGVLTNRGSLYGAIDLGAFIAKSLGSEGLPSPAIAQVHDDQNSVVTLNPLLNVNCALKVSGLSGLRASEFFQSSSPPQVGAPSYFGRQFVDMEGRFWQELDLQTLAHSPEFLNISA